MKPNESPSAGTTRPFSLGMIFLVAITALQISPLSTEGAMRQGEERISLPPEDIENLEKKVETIRRSLRDLQENARRMTDLPKIDDADAPASAVARHARLQRDRSDLFIQLRRAALSSADLLWESREKVIGFRQQHETASNNNLQRDETDHSTQPQAIEFSLPHGLAHILIEPWSFETPRVEPLAIEKAELLKHDLYETVFRVEDAIIRLGILGLVAETRLKEIRTVATANQISAIRRDRYSGR